MGIILAASQKMIYKIDWIKSIFYVIKNKLKLKTLESTTYFSS